MNKDLNFKAIKIKPLLAKIYKDYGKHALFAGVLLILLAYLFVVFKISSLANAEPDPGQQSPAVVIPKIDKSTVDHIQSLENNNPSIHALFDHARNNPFQE